MDNEKQHVLSMKRADYVAHDTVVESCGWVHVAVLSKSGRILRVRMTHENEGVQDPCAAFGWWREASRRFCFLALLGIELIAKAT